METLCPIAIFVIGILVMFRVISTRKSGKHLLWIALIFVFVPVIYGIMKARAGEFFSGSHNWWEYVLGFFVVLIFLRIILNFVFPWRRR
jgi:uncharacterized membrane protein YhaH (DUF805 family)